CRWGATTRCGWMWSEQPGVVTATWSGDCHGGITSIELPALAAGHVLGAVGDDAQRLHRRLLLPDETLGAEPGPPGPGLRGYRTAAPGRPAAAWLVAAGGHGGSGRHGVFSARQRPEHQHPPDECGLAAGPRLQRVPAGLPRLWPLRRQAEAAGGNGGHPAWFRLAAGLRPRGRPL